MQTRLHVGSFSLLGICASHCRHFYCCCRRSHLRRWCWCCCRVTPNNLITLSRAAQPFKYITRAALTRGIGCGRGHRFDRHCCCCCCHHRHHQTRCHLHQYTNCARLHTLQRCWLRGLVHSGGHGTAESSGSGSSEVQCSAPLRTAWQRVQCCTCLLQCDWEDGLGPESGAMVPGVAAVTCMSIKMVSNQMRMVELVKHQSCYIHLLHRGCNKRMYRLSTCCCEQHR